MPKSEIIEKSQPMAEKLESLNHRPITIEVFPPQSQLTGSLQSISTFQNHQLKHENDIDNTVELHPSTLPSSLIEPVNVYFNPGKKLKFHAEA